MDNQRVSPQRGFIRVYAMRTGVLFKTHQGHVNAAHLNMTVRSIISRKQHP